MAQYPIPGAGGWLSETGAASEALPHDWVSETAALARANYYLGSDTTTGGWTPSVGGSLYGTLDEGVPSDSDYDQSSLTPNQDAMECRFVGVQVPQTGHLTL